MPEDIGAIIEAEMNRELARSLAREFVKAKKRVYATDSRIGMTLGWSASGSAPGPYVDVERFGWHELVRLPVSAVADEIARLVVAKSDEMDHVIIPRMAFGGPEAWESRRRIAPPKPAT